MRSFDLARAVRVMRADERVRYLLLPTRSTTKSCSWKQTATPGMRWLPFELMLDVMEFDLDNAIVAMGEGELLRQTVGIPMGSPTSPGMTIGACAWMEDDWMQGLSSEDKLFFRAARTCSQRLHIRISTSLAHGWFALRRT